jgi:hypothetical protein
MHKKGETSVDAFSIALWMPNANSGISHAPIQEKPYQHRPMPF